MGQNKVMFNCQCGDEVLIVEKLFDDSEEYSLSFREMPRSYNLWERVKMVWRWLRGDSQYEIILTKEQLNILKEWVDNNG